MRGPHFDRFDDGHMWQVESLATEGGTNGMTPDPEPNRKWWVAAAVTCFCLHLGAFVALMVVCFWGK